MKKILFWLDNHNTIRRYIIIYIVYITIELISIIPSFPMKAKVAEMTVISIIVSGIYMAAVISFALGILFRFISRFLYMLITGKDYYIIRRGKKYRDLSRAREELPLSSPLYKKGKRRNK